MGFLRLYLLAVPALAQEAVMIIAPVTALCGHRTSSRNWLTRMLVLPVDQTESAPGILSYPMRQRLSLLGRRCREQRVPSFQLADLDSGFAYPQESVYFTKKTT